MPLVLLSPVSGVGTLTCSCEPCDVVKTLRGRGVAIFLAEDSTEIGFFHPKVLNRILLRIYVFWSWKEPFWEHSQTFSTSVDQYEPVPGETKDIFECLTSLKTKSLFGRPFSK